MIKKRNLTITKDRKFVWKCQRDNLIYWMILGGWTALILLYIFVNAFFITKNPFTLKDMIYMGLIGTLIFAPLWILIERLNEKYGRD